MQANYAKDIFRYKQQDHDLAHRRFWEKPAWSLTSSKFGQALVVLNIFGNIVLWSEKLFFQILFPNEIYLLKAVGIFILYLPIASARTQRIDLTLSSRCYCAGPVHYY